MLIDQATSIFLHGSHGDPANALPATHSRASASC